MIARSLAVALLTVISIGASADELGAWQAASQPGHAILMRHAHAPGTGDPDTFDPDDCSTQRNLDEQGRRQARRTGRLLRERGLAGRPVYTSRWCRCRETAELLELGPVRYLDGLNSFFGPRYSEHEVMPRLRSFLRDDPLDPPPVLVTHQVNITALTGIHPREGEMVVIEREKTDDVRVVGRISR